MFSSVLRPQSATVLKHQLRGTIPTCSLAPMPGVAKASQFSTTSLNQTADSKQNPTILLQDKENGFGFARSNPRPKKPRMKGVTEIRGPYYSVLLLWTFWE